MTIKGNTLSDLKKYFFAKLENHFPAHEINALFYILLNDLLGISKQTFFMSPGKRISESEIVQFVDAVKDLKQGKPVSYITGKHIFMDIPLQVDERVLIPRPETEEMVLWAIRHFPAAQKVSVIDVCTGSGCIALAVRKHLPQAEVWATDVSADALLVASENSKHNRLTVKFLQDDILNTDLNKKQVFDLVISNPPYIPEKEKNELDSCVTAFEPHQALFVPDENPLVFYEKIAENALLWLKHNGILVAETHEELAGEVAELFKHQGLAAVEVHQDINRKNRFVSCIKK